MEIHRGDLGGPVRRCRRNPRQSLRLQVIDFGFGEHQDPESRPVRVNLLGWWELGQVRWWKSCRLRMMDQRKLASIGQTELESAPARTGTS